MSAIDYLPIHLITSLSPILYPLFTSIGFTDDSIRLAPVTTYRETVIVKKDCVTNPSGNIELMPGFPRNFPKPITVFCDFDGPIVDVSDTAMSCISGPARSPSTTNRAIDLTASIPKSRTFKIGRAHV